jgi:hypothetical protein
MTATTSVLLAILLLFIAKLIDYLITVDKLKKKNIWSRLTLVSLSALCSLFAIYFFIVYAERKIYQTINSKIVLDFYFQPYSVPNKILRIENRGLLDVNDLHIYFTKYSFSDKAFDSIGKFFPAKKFLDRYSSFGEVPDKEIKDRIIKSKDTVKFTINKYVRMDTSILNYTSLSNFYAIRISFRNSQNGEQFIKYMLTPANTAMPEVFETNIVLVKSIGAKTGPIDTTGKDIISDLRNFIINHQASLFGDDPSNFYKN